MAQDGTKIAKGCPKRVNDDPKTDQHGLKMLNYTGLPALRLAFPALGAPRDLQGRLRIPASDSGSLQDSRNPQMDAPVSIRGFSKSQKLADFDELLFQGFWGPRMAPKSAPEMVQTVTQN